MLPGSISEVGCRFLCSSGSRIRRISGAFSPKVGSSRLATVPPPPKVSTVRFIREIHEQCLKEGRKAVSFEFFPPKTDEGERVLFEETLPALMAVRPDYCSVTYGAGGSTRDKTLAIVDRIQREFSIPAMMHLTCVNSTREQLREVILEAGNRGIMNILALRGDPPGGVGPWTKVEGGFEYSVELVAFIRELGGFCIGTAGFPEGHIACTEGKHKDWGHLKAKIDAGADFVITQLFFQNDDFFEFQAHLRHLGCTVPLIPGMLAVISARQTTKFVELCGAKLPTGFAQCLNELETDNEVAAFGLEYAHNQCVSLLAHNIPGLHFYTINKPHSTVEIVRRLDSAGLLGRV